MKTPEDFLRKYPISLIDEKKGKIYYSDTIALLAMEEYAQMKVNELNKSDVIKSLPSDVRDMIEKFATKRINITEMNEVVIRLEDVKKIISIILERGNVL